MGQIRLPLCQCNSQNVSPGKMYPCLPLQPGKTNHRIGLVGVLFGGYTGNKHVQFGVMTMAMATLNHKVNFHFLKNI